MSNDEFVDTVDQSNIQNAMDGGWRLKPLQAGDDPVLIGEFSGKDEKGTITVTMTSGEVRSLKVGESWPAHADPAFR